MTTTSPEVRLQQRSRTLAARPLTAASLREAPGSGTGVPTCGGMRADAGSHGMQGFSYGDRVVDWLGCTVGVHENDFILKSKII